MRCTQPLHALPSRESGFESDQTPQVSTPLFHDTECNPAEKQPRCGSDSSPSQTLRYDRKNNRLVCWRTDSPYDSWSTGSWHEHRSTGSVCGCGQTPPPATG